MSIDFFEVTTYLNSFVKYLRIHVHEQILIQDSKIITETSTVYYNYYIKGTDQSGGAHNS